MAKRFNEEQSIQDVLKNKKDKIESEVADIMNYLILFAHECDIDIEKVTMDKIKVSNEKYPVDKVKGDYKKYTEL